MAKTEEMVFKASSARVFNACRVAMAQLSYTLISVDETGRVISFNTGRSLKSFAGQDLQATVLDNGDGSRVIVGGTIARRGGMGSGQQIAWGEKAALSKKFLAEVVSVLPNIPEVVQTNVIHPQGVPTIDVDEGDTRTCPYCAETIKSAAIKCRYCGSAIEPKSRDELEPSSIKEIQIEHTQLVTEHEATVDTEPEEGPMSDPEEQTPPVIPRSTYLSAKWYRRKKGIATAIAVLVVIFATSFFTIFKGSHSPGWSNLNDITGSLVENQTKSIASVSCPTSAFCMAVNLNGDSFTYGDGKWSAPDSIDASSNTLFAVSCPTSTFCMAVDANGDSMTYIDGKWSAPKSIDRKSADFAISDISCATSAFCVAVDTNGKSLTYIDGKWSAKESIDPRSADGFGINDVSCPTSVFCVAVDSKGKSLTYIHGKWSAPESIDPQSADKAGINDVSCPTSAYCVAVDSKGKSLSYSDGKWSAPDVIDPQSANNSGFISVSCPTSTFCMTVNSNGSWFTYSDGKWSAAESIEPQSVFSSGGLNYVSCPSATFCMVVDSNGGSLIYNPVVQPQS